MGKGLNDDEKKEIKDDVRTAMLKAFSLKRSVGDIVSKGDVTVLNQDEIDKVMSNKRKKDRKAIFISVVLLVLVGIVGFYLFSLNNPTKIFVTTVDRCFSNFEDVLDEVPDGVQGNVNIENGSSSYLISYTSDDDVFNASLNGKQLYGQDGVVYFHNDESWYETDMLFLSFSDLSVLIDSLNDAIVYGANGEKISGVRKVLDGKEVYESSLVFNDSVVSNIVDFLHDDDDFMDLVLSDDILNFMGSIKEVSFYTSGSFHEFVGFEVKADVDLFLSKVSDSKYDIVVDGNKGWFEFSSSDFGFSLNNLVIDGVYSKFDSPDRFYVDGDLIKVSFDEILK